MHEIRPRLASLFLLFFATRAARLDSRCPRFDDLNTLRSKKHEIKSPGDISVPTKGEGRKKGEVGCVVGTERMVMIYHT